VMHERVKKYQNWQWCSLIWKSHYKAQSTGKGKDNQNNTTSLKI
jgi:hypothetical protein